MNFILKFTLMMCIFFPSFSLLSAQLIQQSAINFGDIVPTTGRCEMDVESEVLINRMNEICLSSKGQAGFFKLYTDANTLTTFTVKTRLFEADGVQFRPFGIAKSNAVSRMMFIPDTPLSIDSGSSGTIEIYIGGVIDITDSVSPNNRIQISYDIEY